jgi:hypothetical protein
MHPPNFWKTVIIFKISTIFTLAQLNSMPPQGNSTSSNLFYAWPLSSHVKWIPSTFLFLWELRGKERYLLPRGMTSTARLTCPTKLSSCLNTCFDYYLGSSSCCWLCVCTCVYAIIKGRAVATGGTTTASLSLVHIHDPPIQFADLELSR